MARDDAHESTSSENLSTPWTLLERVGEHLGIMFTILGVAAYGALRLSFAAFYRHFGVTPEEVGYDYVTVLTVALPGVVTMLLTSLVLASFVYGVFGLVFS